MSITIKEDNEEQEIDLADIANIDMDGIEAFEGGFEPTPVGVYQFNCMDAGIKQINSKGVIYFELEVEAVHALKEGGAEEAEKLLGWKHEETIFITDVKKSVGQAKAIMQNAGFVGQGKLEDILDAFVGTSFLSPTKQRKDPNDADKIYSNLVVKKITPVPTEESEAAA